MCDPTVIALGSLAIGAFSDITAAGAQNKASKANAAAAQRAFTSTLSDINARKAEETESANLVGKQARELSLVEQGLAQTSAAEGGVSGSSVDAQSNVLSRTLGGFLSSLDVSTDNTLRQLDRSKEGAEATRDSRIASVPRASGLATGLRIGGRALSTGASIYDFQTRTK